MYSSCVVGLGCGCRLLSFAALHLEIPVVLSAQRVGTVHKSRPSVCFSNNIWGIWEGGHTQPPLATVEVQVHRRWARYVEHEHTNPAGAHKDHGSRRRGLQQGSSTKRIGREGFILHSLPTYPPSTAHMGTHSAENCTTSSGLARITAFVYSFRMAGRSSATLICSAEKIGAESMVLTLRCRY